MIDVLIPAYNAERTVVSAVRSILDQSLTDLRVVVVNDGSTDRTGSLLTNLAEQDPRLEIHTTVNGGIVPALNTALALSRADFIARHDADDLAYSHRLETQLAYLIANPDCIAVGANARHVDVDGAPFGVTRLSGPAFGNFSSVPAHEPYLLHPLLLVRAAALRQVGGYRHVLHSEDSDLYWRLAPLGRLHNLDDVLADYRIHAGSITSGSRANVRSGAVSSQLGAISARRRSEHREDLQFDAERGRRLQSAPDLQSMVAIAAEQLSEPEIDYLRIATAAKMMELRVYRNFRFGSSDVAFIARQLVRYRDRLSGREWRDLAMKPVHYLRPRVKLRAALRFLGLRDLAARL